MTRAKTFTLYAARHGHTTHNGFHRDPNSPPLFQNHYAPQLSRTGMVQSNQLADFFVRQHPSEGILIITSPALRTVQTATIVASRLLDAGVHVDVKYEKLLLERDVGRKLDGSPIPPQMTEKQIDEYVILQGGEPMRYVWERMAAFRAEMASSVKANDGAVLLALTHEFPKKAFLGHQVGVEMRPAMQHFAFHNCGLTQARVSRKDGIVLLDNFVNYLEHLAPDMRFSNGESTLGAQLERLDTHRKTRRELKREKIMRA